MLPLNQIILGDCLEVMRGLPAHSIDALISDPPYATTDLPWDKKVDWVAFWNEAKRICKPNATIALFAQQPFATDLINSNRKHFRYQIVWEKSLAVGHLDANIRPMRAHELILVFVDKYRGKTPDTRAIYNPQKTKGTPYTSNSKAPSRHWRKSRSIPTTNPSGDRFPRDVIKTKNVHASWNSEAFHPTQKPLDLLSWLVLSYTNREGVVLDPFSGSGTTACARAELGRDFIAIEKDPEYYAKSLQRLSLRLNSAAGTQQG